MAYPAYPPIYPKWMPDQRSYAIEQERYRHDESLAFFGEYALFVFMWEYEDFAAGLVARCPLCYVGYGDIAETYKQAAQEKCPNCFGTTFEGGWREQVVRLSTWDANEKILQPESARGQYELQKATVQTTSGVRLTRSNYVFRGDGSRWLISTVSTNHLREGFEMPNELETPLGYHYAEVVLEDPSSVAYMLPPTKEDLLTLDVTNIRYPPDWSSLEQSRLTTQEVDVTTLSTTPEILDLDLYGGDSFSMRLNFTDQTTQAPWPLQGTWAAQIRSGGEVVESFTIDTSEQAQGVLIVSLSGTQTETISGHPDPELVWDLQQTDGTEIKTWYRGSVKTTSDVTA